MRYRAYFSVEGLQPESTQSNPISYISLRESSVSVQLFDIVFITGFRYFKLTIGYTMYKHSAAWILWRQTHFRSLYLTWLSVSTFFTL